MLLSETTTMKGTVTVGAPSASTCCADSVDARVETLRLAAQETVIPVARRIAEALEAPLGAPAVISETATIVSDLVSKETVRHVLTAYENPVPAVRVASSEELLRMPAPEGAGEVLVGGQLLRGETLGIYGPPGVGKTFLLMQAGLAIAYGVPFLGSGLVPSKPHRCLYLTGEGRQEAHRDRLAAMRPAFESHPEAQPGGAERYMVLGNGGTVPLRIDVPGHAALLKAHIEEHGVEVLLLDTFRTLHTANENDSSEMEAVWCALRRLLDETGCAAILTHHTKKGAGRNRREAARGGSFQENVASAFLVEQAGSGGGVDRLTLHQTKARNCPELRPFTVIRDPASLCFGTDGHGITGDAANGKRPALADALRAAGGSALVKDLAATGLASDKTIKKWAEDEPDRYELSRDGAGARSAWRISLRAAGT
ncbi:AAA family ATPase [Miltoncostaea marina]|uniref:AAA family ATPase n=1 Tax=Miltoncostaea marina TaxID=2843215 RepID=UPI001C3DB33D|nr:AAA family ATPase [Miltoncostaea marina]